MLISFSGFCSKHKLSMGLLDGYQQDEKVPALELLRGRPWLGFEKDASTAKP